MQNPDPGVGDPPEIPPPTPGNPTEPPEESPPGNPRPEIPTPIDDPVEPNPPRELPPDSPDEVPVPERRGPSLPPVNDDGFDLPGSDPDVIPGAPQLPPGTMSLLMRLD